MTKTLISKGGVEKMPPLQKTINWQSMILIDKGGKIKFTPVHKNYQLHVQLLTLIIKNKGKIIPDKIWVASGWVFPVKFS